MINVEMKENNEFCFNFFGKTKEQMDASNYTNEEKALMTKINNFLFEISDKYALLVFDFLTSDEINDVRFLRNGCYEILETQFNKYVKKNYNWYKIQELEKMVLDESAKVYSTNTKHLNLDINDLKLLLMNARMKPLLKVDGITITNEKITKDSCINVSYDKNTEYGTGYHIDFVHYIPTNDRESLEVECIGFSEDLDIATKKAKLVADYYNIPLNMI